jgi:hypothetical protein
LRAQGASIVSHIDAQELRRLAGCTPWCAVDIQPQTTMLAQRIRHNTVRLSRATDVDDLYVCSLLPADLDNLHIALGAWMRAHHRGDTSNPFRHEVMSGQFVEIAEAEG